MIGDRVRLIHCNDPHTRIETGSYGFVVFEDAVGTVHVKWDNGIQLGLVADEDSWEIVDAEVVK